MERDHENQLFRHIHDEKNGLDDTLLSDDYLSDLGIGPGFPVSGTV